MRINLYQSYCCIVSVIFLFFTAIPVSCDDDRGSGMPVSRGYGTGRGTTSYHTYHK